MKYKLFTTQFCHKCPAMKEFMAAQDKVEGRTIDASTPEGLGEAKKNSVTGVPTLIFFNEDGEEEHRCMSKEEAEVLLETFK